jgi:hypothetical protein
MDADWSIRRDGELFGGHRGWPSFLAGWAGAVIRANQAFVGGVLEGVARMIQYDKPQPAGKRQSHFGRYDACWRRRACLCFQR